MKVPALGVLDRFSGILEAEIFEQLPSTNKYLLEKKSDKAFCFAQGLHQSAGVGRHGKVWQDDGESALFSISTKMKLEEMSGLSVIVGVAVAEMLEGLGLKAQIKWPNDIYIRGQKNCGILIELKPRGADLWVVIGVGINVNKAPDVDQPSISLSEVLGREMDVQFIAQSVAASVIDEIVSIKKGMCVLEKSLERYAYYDYLLNKEVNVLSPKGNRVGIARGLSQSGELQVDVEGGREEISSGEVSIRLLGC